eukprot:scaffold991_cov278-Amphora_coffeaeformis.AAC.8
MRTALDRLHPSKRLEYDTAREIAPEIVRSESPISLFLRTEDNHPERAALRLARYWAARKWAFGEQRYLFPLNQTGSGALNADDIALLRTGYHVHFTFDAWTEDGQPGLVALHNEGRITRPAGYAHVRNIFYLCHVNAAYCQNVTVVHVVAGTPRPAIELDPRPWQIFRTALPVRFTQNIVAQAYEQGKEELLDFYGFRCFSVSKYNSRSAPNRIVANSVKATFQMLQSKGLNDTCLPPCLGGSYDYAQHDDWIRRRISVEDILAAAPLRRYRPSAVAQVNQIASVGRRGMLTLVADERARRKYNNKKRQLLLLDQQQSSTSGGGTTTTSHKQEEEEDAVPAELVAKERNNLYSRRSYQKRKLEMFTLENQRDALVSQNQAIQQSNAFLEGLLQQAQAIVAVLPPPPPTQEEETTTIDNLGVTDQEIVGLLRQTPTVVTAIHTPAVHSPLPMEEEEEIPTTADHLWVADPEIFPSFLDPASIMNPWDGTDIGDDHSLCA